MRWIVAAAAVFAGFAGAVNAQRPMPERVILGSLNACWQAEEGANFRTLAWENGFDHVPQARGPLFYRDAGGVVIFVTADFGAGADGRPEPACRITALKPQLNTPWTPRGAPLTNGFVERMARETVDMGAGYELRALRQRHPTRTGRLRTILVADGGARGRVIYIEEGPEDIEVLYFHAARAVFTNPATFDLGTDPAVRPSLQAFVNDRWEIAFCDLNPHACVTAAEQARIDAAARASASAPRALPFSNVDTGPGDNRSQAQQRRDSAWWDNYHRCGSGRC